MVALGPSAVVPSSMAASSLSAVVTSGVASSSLSVSPPLVSSSVATSHSVPPLAASIMVSSFPAVPLSKIGDSLPSGSPLAPCTPVTGVETNESMLVSSIPPAWSTAMLQRAAC